MDLKLPHLGEGADSGTVVNLFIKEGDAVVKDQPILELENEKAVATIPSTAAGTVTKVFIKTGDKISVGQRILTLTEGGGAAPQKPAPKAAAKPEPAPAKAEPVAASPVRDGEPEAEPPLTEARPGVPPAAAPSIERARPGRCESQRLAVPNVTAPTPAPNISAAR